MNNLLNILGLELILMWIVFCWKFKKLFIVFNVEEYIYCSIVFLLDNISWVFRLRDVFYIKKIVIFLWFLSLD